MKRRKQGVKINDTESLFKILLSGMLQGSNPRSHFVQQHFVQDDLLFFTNEAKLANFANDYRYTH